MEALIRKRKAETETDQEMVKSMGALHVSLADMQAKKNQPPVLTLKSRKHRNS